MRKFKQYIREESLRKQAGAAGTAAKVAGGAVGGGLLIGAGKKIAENLLDKSVTTPMGWGKDFATYGLKAALLTIPATGLLAAYLGSKILSPKHLAENSSDIAINAMARESLAQSMRDLEEMKAAKKLTGKPKIHDQYV